MSPEELADRAMTVVRLLSADRDLADAKEDLLLAMREAEVLTLVAFGYVFRDPEDGESPLRVEPVVLVLGWNAELGMFDLL